MSSGSGLPPAQHAAFAVVSRLVSCLVTEQLLRGFYLPISQSCQASGVLIVLSTHLMSETPVINRSLCSNDIFAIVPLRHPPVLRGASIHKHGQPVGLIDPLDMLPVIYELAETLTQDGEPHHDQLQKDILGCLVPPPWELGRFTTLMKNLDPIHFWRKFVDGVVIQDNLREVIEKELESSLHWQYLAYESPPECPSLTSPPIEWEQSLVAGHPTHPMHRARMLSSGSGEDHYDWYNPLIRFVKVPRTSLSILGSFENTIHTLAEKAAKRCGRIIPVDEKSVLMPVHELQIPTIRAKFQDVEILHPDINLRALAQSSIRTVIIPELPGMALKLAVAVKISSSLRTISHFTADFGPRFSAEIVPKLTFDSTILSVECEPSSAVYHTDNPELAKHFTAVLREEYEPADGESLIVCAALLETDHSNTPLGTSAIEHILGLNTEDKKSEFLNQYIKLACEALLPPLIHNGVSFEAHAQNVLVRINHVSKLPVGFVVRDLGGLRIHPATLRQSTGVNFQFLPGHCVITGSVEDTYPKFYHTFVHNHIQRLIRVLGMHSNGRGWEMLRAHMRSVIPESHGLRSAWLKEDSSEVPAKCLLRMRMQDMYREMVFSPVPNMIQVRPESLPEGLAK
ncbi:IucC family-domain-containing protein [Infundibulicybe gibba]|nr:IucC family-domain-containing protein [Infundibulicybe gibba]